MSKLDPTEANNHFLVERYETTITVKALKEPQTFTFPIKDGAAQKHVETNNIAKVDRKVTFSHQNVRRSLFTIKYSTRNDGYLAPEMSHPNEASPGDNTIHEDYGTAFAFRFTPEPGETYSLGLQIYKGFQDGNCDVHFHLGNETFYKRLDYTLDLTGCLNAGYITRKSPKLHLYMDDPGHTELCGRRDRNSGLEPTLHDTRGIWSWHLENIHQGVVDIEWERPPS